MILIVLIIAICVIFILRINKMENYIDWESTYASLRNQSNTRTGRGSSCIIDATNRRISCEMIDGLLDEGCRKTKCREASERCTYNNTDKTCKDKSGVGDDYDIYYTGSRSNIDTMKLDLKQRCEATNLMSVDEGEGDISPREYVCNNNMFCKYDKPEKKCLIDTDEYNSHVMVTNPTDGTYNCNSKEVWSSSKKSYCCLNKNKGCRDYYDCNSAKQNWTAHQKTFCEAQETATTSASTSTSSSSSRGSSASSSSSSASSSRTNNGSSTTGEDDIDADTGVDGEVHDGTYPVQEDIDTHYTAKLHRRTDLIREPEPEPEADPDLEIETELSVGMNKELGKKYEEVENDNFCTIM